MSKKSTKDSASKPTIEEKTAEFLKSGGSIQYVEKGKSGQALPAGSKPSNTKSS